MEGIETRITQVMPRQMRCRTNEKRKEPAARPGGGEFPGAGREESSECAQASLPVGSEGFGPAHCDVTTASWSILIQSRASRRKGKGSGVRRTCMQTPASPLDTPVALGK